MLVEIPDTLPAIRPACSKALVGFRDNAIAANLIATLSGLGFCLGRMWGESFSKTVLDIYLSRKGLEITDFKEWEEVFKPKFQSALKSIGLGNGPSIEQGSERFEAIVLESTELSHIPTLSLKAACVFLFSAVEAFLGDILKSVAKEHAVAMKAGAAFKSRDGIKRAYEHAFGGDPDIMSQIHTDALRSLAEIRHCIIHSGLCADNFFLRAVQGIQKDGSSDPFPAHTIMKEFSTLKHGDAIPINEELIAKLFDGTIKSCYLVAEKIDAWITAHP